MFQLKLRCSLFTGLWLLVAILTTSACDIGTSPQPSRSAANNGALPAAAATSRGDSGEPMILAGPEPTMPCPDCVEPTPQPVATIPDAPSSGPNQGGLILLNDDFTSSSISNYTIVDPGSGPYALPSHWVIEDGVLKQEGTAAGTDDANETLAVRGAAWANYRVQVAGYSINTPIGVVARYTKDGFYLLSLRADSNLKPIWVLERYDVAASNFAKQTTLGSGNAPSAVSPWRTIGLQVVGTGITAFVDGTQVTTVSDSQYSQGQAGVFAEASRVRFDNLYVELVTK